MKYIILDANFIFAPVQLKVDIYKQFADFIPKPWSIVVLSAVLTEIERKVELSEKENKTKFQHQYKLARKLLEQNKYTLVERTRESYDLVDDLILDYAIECQNHGDSVFLATNDKELRRKSRKAQIKVVFIRQGKYISLE